MTAPEVRALREAATVQTREAQGRRWAESLLCDRCERPTVRKAWHCTCRREPDWARLAATAELLARGRAA